MSGSLSVIRPKRESTCWDNRPTRAGEIASTHASADWSESMQTSRGNMMDYEQ